MSQPSSRTAVRSALLTASALVLTAIFLDQHRAELGSFSATVPAFSATVNRYGILNIQSAAHSTAGVLAAMLVVVAWYGLGAALLGSVRSAVGARSCAGPRPCSALELAAACAVGAGTWSLLWFALGLVGLYRPSTALAALGGGLAFAARAVVRSRRTSSLPHAVNGGRAERSALVLVAAPMVALPVALAFVAALAPPTAKDALQYHLALPKAFVAARGLIDVPDNIANYFALGAEMHGVWAMLLGRIVSTRAGEVAFGAVTFAFFPLLLAAVFGWARERGLGRDWAWLATAMVAGVPTIFEVAGSGYVDLALALYVTLAIRSMARWWGTQDRAHLAESGLALGFALAVKPTAGFVVCVCVLIVLLRTRRTESESPEGRGPLVAGLAALAGAVALGCPWSLRTWARTGSPVFPFFANVWPGRAPGWDPERSAMLVGFNALYGGTHKGPVDYLLTPFSLSLTGQREIAAAYEGVLGVSFLVGAALIVWAFARLDTELKIAAVAGGAFFVWWLVSAQVLRYLLPALPLLAVASAGAGAVLTTSGAVSRSLRWALAAPVIASEIVIVAWFVGDNPLLAVTGGEPRAAYLERRLDYYSYYRLIHESLPASVKIWLVDVRRDTYHLERPYVGDYLFEDYTLRTWIEQARSGRDVQQRARAAGITHVLIRHDILFDYARSPLVDDRAPETENLARLERLRSFLADGTRVIRADRRFALVELAPGLAQAPPVRRRHRAARDQAAAGAEPRRSATMPSMSGLPTTPLVAIIMGSKSDWNTMSHASQALDALGIPHDVRVMSAHRTPALVDEYVGGAESRGIEVIIAGAAGAAHLAGVAAAKTLLPVLGVPIQSNALNGMDSLLSTVQMPGGIPVGTLAIGNSGATNAGLLAAAILANKYPAVREALRRHREAQTQAVLAQSDPRASKPSFA